MIIALRYHTGAVSISLDIRGTNDWVALHRFMDKIRVVISHADNNLF
jgi:hypothetical protein